MSFDRHIDQVCPHLVREELLFLNSDQQTVRPVRPISSTDSVVMRLNGGIDIPSFGVEAPAQSEGTKQGPFQVRLPTLGSAGTNRLRLRVNSGSVQTVHLPSSSKMTATQMADLLNRGFRGVTFYDMHNRLGFRTNEAGAGSSVFIDPTSTLGSLVGIATGREYRGRRVLPGWSLVNTLDSLTDRPLRLVVFDEPLKGYNDFVELDYVTVRQECRRCGGTGVEQDWRYAANGTTGEVRDEALLIQEVKKSIYTVAGSNPFHPWYGSQLLEQIGKKVIPGGMVQNLITQDIYTAFQRWQSIKVAQETQVGQFVSDEEFPSRILGVTVEQSSKDPTVVFVNITLQNRSGKQVQIDRGLRLPQPLDLLNSTTASDGAYRQSLRNFNLTE
jgi:phage baseplate assembly protein W